MSIEIIPMTREPSENHRGKGPRGWRPDDGRLLEEICARMADDPWLDAREVEVAVEDGIATLRGTVRTQVEKRRAEDIAAHVRGVYDVMNELRVPSVFAEGEEHLVGGTLHDQGPTR